MITTRMTKCMWRQQSTAAVQMFTLERPSAEDLVNCPNNDGKHDLSSSSLPSRKSRGASPIAKIIPPTDAPCTQVITSSCSRVTGEDAAQSRRIFVSCAVIQSSETKPSTTVLYLLREPSGKPLFSNLLRPMVSPATCVPGASPPTYR